IKPANILIDREGTVKLVDFGLAEILATNAYAGGAGTYAYMAPEDFAEEDRSDSQSDIWAVGATLYEMITGARPFQVARAKDPFAWKRALETEAATPVARYLEAPPAGLQSIFDLALARDKRSRYRTAAQFRDDILRLQHGDSSFSRIEAAPREGSSGERAAPVGVITRETQQLSTQAQPGVVVAEVAVPALDAHRRRIGPLRRSNRAARLIVSPEMVDFGAVRKGDSRSAKIVARVVGLDGAAEGKVTYPVGWISAFPQVFSGRKQTITLTAHSANTWETGQFEEKVRIETAAGASEIPVRLTVLKARPTFAEISYWYLPLFVAALLPAIGVAGQSHNAAAIGLTPVAAAASALLFLMLLLVGAGAEIGAGEQIACAVLTAVMAFVLGVALRDMPSRTLASSFAMQRVMVTGCVLGGVLLLQVFHLNRWRVWAVAQALLAVGITGVLLRMLSG
ncbi:MAG TPA: protein kinase, partial [Chthonomonadales bacterium]|nr:protein kinase [Chthonomonadales bacterium]